MTFFRSWSARRRQKKLDKHKIYCPKINWTIQLPVDFTLKSPANAQKSYDRTTRLMGPPAKSSIYQDNNLFPLFSCSYDKFNGLSAAIVKVAGCSQDQLLFSREDCKDRLFRMFSRIPGAKIERSSSAVSVGGMIFDQYSLLVTRNGKPIFCFEYLYHTIAEYELSISITYNNETQRVKMYRCLDESKF